MNYLITAEQKTFFEKHHFIEFEELVTESQLAILKKCKESGRDVARKDSKVEKIVRNSLFAKLTKELFLQRELRLGYDEIFELPLVFSKPMTLAEVSAVAPLVAGLMICIEGESGNPANQISEIANGSFDPFPQKPGNALFFLPTLSWDIEAIAKRSKQKFLLITYATRRAMYIFQDKDPYVHTLKRLGYVFGDRLIEKYHPTLGR